MLRYTTTATVVFLLVNDVAQQTCSMYLNRIRIMIVMSVVTVGLLLMGQKDYRLTEPILSM